MKKLYFIVGSQDLYGEETLKKVRSDSEEMTSFLDRQLQDLVRVELLPMVTDADTCEDNFIRVQSDKDCVGVLCWMHTFSPSKMWIRGLKLLQKPMLHLHTQANEKLPYSEIDMDFMNLNQSAHGDREFGFMCTRMNIRREVVSGYYRHADVIHKIRRFAEVALAVDYSSRLRVAMFGNNMRDVGVTDGDRVESEIVYGWNTNYYGVGDFTDILSTVTEAEIDGMMKEYSEKYEMNTKNVRAVREQAAYEVAFRKFMKRERVQAITDTFQDLHGMNQLPGLAVQDLMAHGVGFGPEGDYKTAALMAVFCKLAEKRKGATAFLEDYTYGLEEGKEVELASHMLEVSPVFAAEKPKIEVHPLSIGGKSDPARLVFDSVTGDAVSVSLVDLGTHFRLVCAKLKLVRQEKEMPKLPVARVMYRHVPDFETATEAWIEAGGAHHAVLSTALNVEDIRLFAFFTGTELIVIDENTKRSFNEK